MGGAALPALMGAQVGAGAFTAWAQGQQGQAQSAYYGYLANTSMRNADLAQKAARSQIQEVGAQAAQEDRRIGEKVRGTVGAQTAAFAANGVGVRSKTAEQIVSDTMDKGNIDEMALRYNAAIKSKAIQTGADFQTLNDITQAGGYRLAGQNAQTQAKIAQISTYLGTGSSVASTWYRGNTPFPRYGYGGGY